MPFCVGRPTIMTRPHAASTGYRRTAQHTQLHERREPGWAQSLRILLPYGIGFASAVSMLTSCSSLAGRSNTSEMNRVSSGQ